MRARRLDAIGCKLAVLIVAMGLMGAELISLRQQRLLATGEIARSRLRTDRLAAESAALRSMLAEELRPDLLGARTRELGEFRPVIDGEMPPAPTPAPEATLHTVSLVSEGVH